jgi:hypothetical protein
MVTQYLKRKIILLSNFSKIYSENKTEYTIKNTSLEILITLWNACMSEEETLMKIKIFITE